MRARLAPSAARTAISFCRPSARESSRFATLAQAISSTNPTAPSEDDQRLSDVADDLLLSGSDANVSPPLGG